MTMNKEQWLSFAYKNVQDSMVEANNGNEFLAQIYCGIANACATAATAFPDSYESVAVAVAPIDREFERGKENARRVQAHLSGAEKGDLVTAIGYEDTEFVPVKGVFVRWHPEYLDRAYILTGIDHHTVIVLANTIAIKEKGFWSEEDFE